jgi:hypothetical protein
VTESGESTICRPQTPINLNYMNEQQGKKEKQKDDRGRTNVPGGNPRQNDAVDHDLYNDENRPNLAQKKSGKQ